MTKKFEDILSDPDGKCFLLGDEDISIGYGADAYYITEDDIKNLRNGSMLYLDSQGEYAVYLKIHP